MRLLFSVMCFSLFVSCGGTGTPDTPGDCSKNCNQIKPEEEKDLSNHPFYNTLHGTNCSIPEGTEVVHYPMIHPMSREIHHLSEENADQLVTLFDFEKAVSYSSFNFLKLVEKHPSALIFSEMAWTQEMLNVIYQGIEEKRESNELFSDFPVHIKSVDSYEALNSEDSLEVLSQSTGVFAAILANVVNKIYPSTMMSSIEEISASYWGKYDIGALSVSEKMSYLAQRVLKLSGQFSKETDEVKKKKLKEMIYHIYREQHHLMKLQFDYLFTYREGLLFESVENVINQPDNNNRLAVINYGAAHNFSDDFKYYNFYTLPYACTISESYLSSHQFTILLIGIYEQIAIIDLTDKEDILEILFSEIMNRINHLSEEGRKDLKNILDNTSKVASGITSSIEVTTLAMRAYLLTRSSDSDQNRFENSFNHYISLSDSDREKLNEVFTEKLQIIRHQKKLQNKVTLDKSEITDKEADSSDNGFGSSDGVKSSEPSPADDYPDGDNGFSKPLPADDPEGQEFLEEADGDENEGIWESVKDWWNSW